ncbi:MAG: UDP-N-acetylmuramate dehydrogenase [Prolixibacteraceae bacterium]|jgi:UDP-N-acetylmuramate dehydrogenase|nr:UDP-N-acetylmuramate dehydrogenase [Prolixibacteraceae bacterium]
MIRLIDNFDLTTYNSFNLKVNTDRFFEFTEVEELQFFLQTEKLPEKYLVLGGGSNLLFQNNFEGLLIHPNLQGVGEINEDRNYIYLEAGCGVEWDDLVRLSVQYELSGLENLSLIPGNVGAAPVQNIGAYGVEAKDRIHLVRGVNLESNEVVEFTNEECKFGYRNSIFKNELKNKVVVTSVVFKLDKFPEFNLEYGALKSEVDKLGEVNTSNVRQTVISIRESKLPDPAKVGNAGSFFKNPIVSNDFANRLKTTFKDLPVYASSEEQTKLAAGWLIEKCGWKGFREGDVGVHPNQALVIVNYGNAKGEQLVHLSTQIKNSVFEKFGVQLDTEVNII